MICPKCARTIPDTSPYCAYCGAQVLPRISPTSRSRSRSKVILALSAVVLVGAVGLWAAGVIEPRSPQVAMVTPSPDPPKRMSVPEPVQPTAVNATATPYPTNTPTPTIVVTPSSAPTPQDRPAFAVGDYFVYDRAGTEYRYEVVDVELLGGSPTWVVLITTDSSFFREYTVTDWVDQETGVVVKVTGRIVYSTPQTWYVEQDRAIETIEDRATTHVDLDNDTASNIGVAVDTSGKEHEYQWTGPANYSVFIVTRDLQVGDSYPWETAEHTHQVIREERVSVPAGAFSCWVIKHVQNDHQYYLEWYDKETGIMVREENWFKSNGAWEMISHGKLTRFRIDSMSQ